MKKRGNNKGQVTIFLIVGIFIVVAAILVYMFLPQIKSTLGIGAQNPNAFIQSCLEDEITANIEKLSSQGGSLSPEHYILYQSDKIEYLCYTNEYYKTCVMQQPMLKQHIEKEIKDKIKGNAVSCFDDLKDSYEKKGYTVSLRPGEVTVELLPKRVVSTFNYSLTLNKDSVESYDSFNVIVNNNLYELVSIANSILNWETRYGDAETTAYMNYYHDLKVEKKLQSEGSTVYIITDRNNGNKFQFASRSVAWPPGYGG